MTSLLKILFIYLGSALLLYAGFSPFTLLMNYYLYFFWQQHEGVNSTQKEICVREETHGLPSHTPVVHASNCPASWNFLFLWQLAQSSVLQPWDPRTFLCHLLKSGSYTTGQCCNPLPKKSCSSGSLMSLNPPSFFHKK